MSSQARFRIVLVLAFILVAGIELGASGYLKFLSLVYQTHIKDPSLIHSYFVANPIRRLQLGAGGSNPEGWLNSDIEPTEKQVYLDVTARFPFDDNSFRYIFSEHLIEHLSWEAGLSMLQESRRVLMPGGKIRIETPNLLRYFRLINSASEPDVQGFIEARAKMFAWPENPVMPLFIFNKEMREWGHQFIYDPVTLRKTLELAGFHNIKEYSVNERGDPEFEKVQYRKPGNTPDYVWKTNGWEAMAFEAVK